MLRRLLPLLAAASPLLAEDWPEFRGPVRQGMSSATGLPNEWDAVSKNIFWKVEVPGIGWSSPVVIGDHIYLTSAVPEGPEGPEAERSLRAICLQAADGKILWSQEIFYQTSGAATVHKKNSHASPTPVFEDGRLYVHFGHQGSACLNAADGSILWKTQEFVYSPVHGNGGSPVIEGGFFIFNADAQSNPAVFALDKNTGKLAWKFDRRSDAKNKFSFSTPLGIEVNGKRQLITAGSGVVNALEPQTGTEIWHASYDQGFSVVPRPVFAHGMIYLSTGYGKPVCLAIRADGTGDVTETHIAWKIEKFVPHNPSMVVVGDEIYFVADNGVLTSANAKTGEVYYQERCTGPISSSILHADGRLYLQDEKGQGVVVKTGKTFEVISKNNLAEKSLASYAVIENHLLIRTESHLWRIGGK